jgi:hypothetical protein
MQDEYPTPELIAELKSLGFSQKEQARTRLWATLVGPNVAQFPPPSSCSTDDLARSLINARRFLGRP